jgi:hypothetical protein
MTHIKQFWDFWTLILLGTSYMAGMGEIIPDLFSAGTSPTGVFSDSVSVISAEIDQSAFTKTLV